MQVQETATPAVAIDLGILEKNLDRMAAYCQNGNLGLRPHTKTHKTPEVAAMQVARGARGLSVAKVGEAEVMAAARLDDILIAYPVFGTENLRRLARLAAERRITMSLDSEAAAGALSRAASEVGSSVSVLVEFDSGFDRCGLPPGLDCVRLARIVENLPKLRFRGLMTFFGSVWGSESERASQMHGAAQAVDRVLSAFSAARMHVEIVSGGSTPSALLADQVPGLTEIRPGTYVYNDLNTFYQGLCGIEDCAARVVTTVVSTAVANRAIIDAGSKTLSSDPLLSGPQSGFGYVVEHPEAKLFSLNEEHGYIDISECTKPVRVGDVLTIVPNHVCSCINLHDEVALSRDGEAAGQWRVAARGKVR